MAVAATVARSSHTETANTTQEYCIATLSGTYVPGTGFSFNPRSITSSLGSSPMAGSKVLDIAWRSLLGYIYSSVTTTSGNVSTTTTKIYTAPNVELTGIAVPETSVPFVITKSKI